MKIFLFFLLAFVAASAILAGVIMMSHNAGGIFGLTPAMLAGTPFTGFAIPGLILSGIGVTNFVAILAAIEQHRRRYKWTFTGGGFVCAWELLRMLLTRTTHVSDMVYLFAGILIILIAVQLKGKALF